MYFCALVHKLWEYLPKRTAIGVASLQGYQTEIGFRLTDLVAADLRAPPAGERCAVEVVDGLCG
jgi:hypothetical protein